MSGFADEDDASLVTRAQAGDGEAFGALVRRYEARTYRLVRRIVGDDEAEDALQETFLSAWRALPRFAGASSFSTWLYRIATNAALMRVRKRRPDVVPLDAPVAGDDDGHTIPRELVDWGPTPEQTLSDVELRAALDEAIAALPAEQRAAFLLRDVEELGNAEAATALELSVPAFKARVHRARLFLRDRLDRRFRDGVRPGA